MKIIFVRHSQTIDSREWHEKVELRPLSKTGVVRAEMFAKVVERIYRHSFEYIFSSEYVRSIQTAEILRKYLKPLHFMITDTLNPDKSGENFIEFLKKVPVNEGKFILAVTHSPLIENIISFLTRTNNTFHFKKPSLCEILISNDKTEIIRLFNYDEIPTGIKMPIKKSMPYEEEIEELELG